jgi:hypothetical protein
MEKQTAAERVLERWLRRLVICDPRYQPTIMELTNIKDDDARSIISDDDMPLEKRCLYVPQGAGGIYTLPMNLPDLLTGRPHISTVVSTSGCMTCLGVYIPIDDTRCFVAHIDGNIYHPGDRTIVNWQIPSALHTSFQNAVRKQLDHTFSGVPEVVRKIQQSKVLKERVVLVSFWPTVGGQTGPASLAIDVVCQYFLLDKAKLLNKCGVNHGFIIDHSDKSPRGTTLLGWDCPGPAPQVLDEIALLADNCDKPAWGENFKSILNATYTYVMPDTLGWKTRGLQKDQENFPWYIEYEAQSGTWVSDS